MIHINIGNSQIHLRPNPFMIESQSRTTIDPNSHKSNHTCPRAHLPLFSHSCKKHYCKKKGRSSAAGRNYVTPNLLKPTIERAVVHPHPPARPNHAERTTESAVRRLPDKPNFQVRHPLRRHTLHNRHEGLHGRAQGCSIFRYRGSTP